ncbi:uncharacterized protein JCM10292_001799 [Rhodotorula paludigena]|uniref:uncharacterized protein n=1 Tax=Rhodotorula paludigena TaxID=86838 RepID=UPI00317FBAE1
MVSWQPTLLSADELATSPHLLGSLVRFPLDKELIDSDAVLSLIQHTSADDGSCCGILIGLEFEGTRAQASVHLLVRLDPFPRRHASLIRTNSFPTYKLGTSLATLLVPLDRAETQCCEYDDEETARLDWVDAHPLSGLLFLESHTGECVLARERIYITSATYQINISRRTTCFRQATLPLNVPHWRLLGNYHNKHVQRGSGIDQQGYIPELQRASASASVRHAAPQVPTPSSVSRPSTSTALVLVPSVSALKKSGPSPGFKAEHSVGAARSRTGSTPSIASAPADRPASAVSIDPTMSVYERATALRAQAPTSRVEAVAVGSITHPLLAHADFAAVPLDGPGVQKETASTARDSTASDSVRPSANLNPRLPLTAQSAPALTATASPTTNQPSPPTRLDPCPTSNVSAPAHTFSPNQQALLSFPASNPYLIYTPSLLRILPTMS